MSFKDSSGEQLPIYEFLIKGQLDGRWQEWFDGLEVSTVEGGLTVLRGPIRDQAFLHGVFKKISNLGLTLLSVNPVDATER